MWSRTCATSQNFVLILVHCLLGVIKNICHHSELCTDFSTLFIGCDQKHVPPFRTLYRFYYIVYWVWSRTYATIQNFVQILLHCLLGVIKNICHHSELCTDFSTLFIGCDQKHVQPFRTLYRFYYIVYWVWSRTWATIQNFVQILVHCLLGVIKNICHHSELCTDFSTLFIGCDQKHVPPFRTLYRFYYIVYWVWSRTWATIQNFVQILVHCLVGVIKNMGHHSELCTDFSTLFSGSDQEHVPPVRTLYRF